MQLVLLLLCYYTTKFAQEAAVPSYVALFKYLANFGLLGK